MKKLKNKQAIKASKIAKTENLKNKTIIVKNAEGEPDTEATILLQNKISYTPKVSVIIPVYNTEEYLRECLESVVNQTLKEIEIICVDDGSTDSSLEILKEYAAKDNRFTIITQKNLHAGVARNAGLAVAKGEYVHFLDSDDWIELNTYEKLYKIIKNKKVDMLKFKSFTYDNKTKRISTSYLTDMKGVDKKYFDNYVSLNDNDVKNIISISDAPWSGIYKNIFLKNNDIRFNNFLCSNDVSFYYRCIEKSDKFYLSSEHFVFYRINNNKSLIGIRPQHFDCQLKQYDEINNIVKNHQKQTIVTIRKHLLQAILYKYNLYMKDNEIPYDIKQKMFKETQSFMLNISKDLIDSKDKFIYDDLTKKDKLVSIIIPIFNTEKYLRECLDSVINQTLKNIEIICINDASTDNSLKILQEYAERDGRIIVINNEKNLGAPGAVKNIGIKRATGEYIGFVDSDDWVDVDYFKKLYCAAKKHQADIAASTTLAHVFSDKINKKHISCHDGILMTPAEKSELMKISGSNWSKIYKKTIIDKNNIRCCATRNIAEDNYFSMCVMCVANKIITINDACYYYRHREGSVTANKRTDKDFYILQIYKDIDSWIVQFYKKNRTLKIKYLEVVKQRKIQDFKWFIADCEGKYIEDFKEKLKLEFTDIYNELIEPELIISLTSYPARINTVNQTIESLFNQTMKADKVILWLAPEQFPNKEADLPPQLLALKDKGLTIDWYHDIKSYKKLIPTLKKYPEAIIVTADDDNIYQKTCIEKLYNTYEKNKNCIVAHRTTRLYQKHQELQIVPRIHYANANRKEYKSLLRKPSVFNMQTGCGAVLYPQGCFYKDILNEDLIKQLAPTNDDQWFWAMGLLNNYKVMLADGNEYNVQYIPGTQEGECLWKINDRGEKLYFRDLERILHYYPNIRKMLKQENIENNKVISGFFVSSIENYKILMIDWYKRSTGKYLNLNNPQTYNEKLQWLKLYNATPIKTRLADKYLVRDWIKEKIGEEYLVPLLGVYDKFEDIDFDKLPNQFVMKCNHGSGWNIIVTDKSKLNLADAKTKIDRWMNENFAFKCGFELHYRDIQPKIIIEEYMNPQDAMYEIQVWTFNGEIKFISIETIKDASYLERGTFYIDGSKTEFKISPQHYNDLSKQLPSEFFDKTVELSKKLLIDTPYVRIDFAQYKDSIKFREMTFTSGSGLSSIKPDNYNLKLGKMLKLPKLAYNIDTGEYYKLPKKSRVLSYLQSPYYLLKYAYLQSKCKRVLFKSVLKQLRTTRVDVKNFGTAANALEVLETKAAVSSPAWAINAQGQGKVLVTNNLKNIITLRAIKAGKLRLEFKGQDKRKNGTRFPIWIDYSSIKIDGKELLSAPIATWHDKPYRYEMPVKDGQVVKVEVVQQYHQYSKAELRDVILKLNPNSDYIQKHIKKLAKKLAKKMSINSQNKPKKTLAFRIKRALGLTAGKKRYNQLMTALAQNQESLLREIRTLKQIVERQSTEIKQLQKNLADEAYKKDTF